MEKYQKARKILKFFDFKINNYTYTNPAKTIKAKTANLNL